MIAGMQQRSDAMCKEILVSGGWEGWGAARCLASDDGGDANAVFAVAQSCDPKHVVGSNNVGGDISEEEEEEEEEEDGMGAEVVLELGANLLAELESYARLGGYSKLSHVVASPDLTWMAPSQPMAALIASLCG